MSDLTSGVTSWMRRHHSVTPSWPRKASSPGVRDINGRQYTSGWSVASRASRSPAVRASNPRLTISAFVATRGSVLPGPILQSRMKVLLTNDDGIQATGLNHMRRALLEVPDIELAVIAPDSNRSATARSITTRRPLWVEEIDFGDGSTGFATDGTPVDCVRFAALGLVEFQPELIISGINHGANLGDDITYSGTVAA